MDKLRMQRISASTRGMVATAHYAATEAGVEMLEAGGNAIDAAVAAAFALGVCEPQASGLGGQTMMLIHLTDPHRNIAVDGSSRAPSRATLESFANRTDRYRGYRATTVPSTPAVLGYVAGKYSRLPLAKLLEPAIRLAEQGCEISELQSWLQQREQEHWADGNAKDLFLKPGGESYQPGEIFKQPALAATLRRLAKKGIEDFYTGRIGRQIVADMELNDGLIRRDDLGLIPWPIERRPVSCHFHELRVMTMPPPGAGRTLIEMLNVLSLFEDKRLNPNTPRAALLLTEVIKRAQFDRRDRPFEPNFYPQIEERQMTSLEYAKLVAKQIRARISPRQASKLTPGQPAPPAPPQGGETTHLSVMDRDGNIVGLTQSIERVYGAFAATPELGFLYNNYLTAYEQQDYTHPYYLRPNAVPWASVAPTIAFKGRRPWAVLGSPGSDRIVSAVLQVLLRLRKQSPLEAVVAPRLHCSADGIVTLEQQWMRDDIAYLLRKRGFKVDKREAFSFYMGCVQLVKREGKVFIGVADPRRDGSAGGPTR